MKSSFGKREAGGGAIVASYWLALAPPLPLPSEVSHKGSSPPEAFRETCIHKNTHTRRAGEKHRASDGSHNEKPDRNGLAQEPFCFHLQAHAGRGAQVGRIPRQAARPQM